MPSKSCAKTVQFQSATDQLNWNLNFKIVRGKKGYVFTTAVVNERDRIALPFVCLVCSPWADHEVSRIMWKP